MKRFNVRTTMVITVEYAIDPSYYPEGSTVEEMLALDRDIFKKDPDLLFSLGEVDVEVKTERVDE